MDTLSDSASAPSAHDHGAAREIEPSAGEMCDGGTARIAMFGSSSALLTELRAYARRMGTNLRLIHERPDLSSRVERRAIDVVVLDATGMDFPAHDLVRALRRDSNVGIIVMSAQSDVADCVLALEFGADDVIVQPTENREMLARIRSLARRVRAEHTQSPNGYEFDDWRLDLFARTLHRQQDQPVRLTSREFEVLCLLLDNANQAVPRGRIHPCPTTGVDTRAADALVGRLRRKLVAAGARERLIRPVRSIGYLLAAQVSQLHSE